MPDPVPLLPRRLQPGPVRDAVVEPPTTPRPRPLKALGRVTPGVRYVGPVQNHRDRWMRRLGATSGWLLETKDHVAFQPVGGLPTVLPRTAVRRCLGEGQLVKGLQKLIGDASSAAVFELHDGDHLDVWLPASRPVRLRTDAWADPGELPAGALGPTRMRDEVTPDDLAAASADPVGLALWAELAEQAGADEGLIAMARGLSRSM